MEPRPLDPDRLVDHVDRLYRAAWGLCGSREDAEDLVQETYVRVLAKPRMLRDPDELGYLMRVLRNTFVSRHRAASRRIDARAMPEGREPVDEGIAGRPHDMTETREVFTAIAALPPDFRDALVAVDLAGLSYAEAGKLLGAKEATITSRLHRARRQAAAALRAGDDDVGQDHPRQGVL